ncbi:class I SAM-dependent methyltransferase [Kocuria rhizophila]|nr:class I SAM-dependent methyltransferase [Kocuria rhizophila]
MLLGSTCSRTSTAPPSSSCSAARMRWPCSTARTPTPRTPGGGTPPGTSGASARRSSAARRVRATKRVLDIGRSTGALTAESARRGAVLVTAVDASDVARAPPAPGSRRRAPRRRALCPRLALPAEWREERIPETDRGERDGTLLARAVGRAAGAPRHRPGAGGTVLCHWRHPSRTGPWTARTCTARRVAARTCGVVSHRERDFELEIFEPVPWSRDDPAGRGGGPGRQRGPARGRCIASVAAAIAAACTTARAMGAPSQTAPGVVPAVPTVGAAPPGTTPPCRRPTPSYPTPGRHPDGPDGTGGPGASALLHVTVVLAADACTDRTVERARAPRGRRRMAGNRAAGRWRRIVAQRGRGPAAAASWALANSRPQWDRIHGRGHRSAREMGSPTSWSARRTGWTRSSAPW